MNQQEMGCNQRIMFTRCFCIPFGNDLPFVRGNTEAKCLYCQVGKTGKSHLWGPARLKDLRPHFVASEDLLEEGNDRYRSCPKMFNQITIGIQISSSLHGKVPYLKGRRF